MFQLTKDEWAILKSQFVMSSWGGRRREPFALTERGVLMLSSVLSSQRAVQINIRISGCSIKFDEQDDMDSSNRDGLYLPDDRLMR